jgi:hypothetical protein
VWIFGSKPAIIGTKNHDFEGPEEKIKNMWSKITKSNFMYEKCSLCPLVHDYIGSKKTHGYVRRMLTR